MKTLRRSGSQRILENNTIMAAWLMMTLFNLGVVVTTGLILTDRYPTDGDVFPRWVIVLFWVGAIFCSIFTYSKTRTRLTIDRQGGTLAKIDILCRASTVQFKPQDVERFEVTTTTDVDGDPYYYCELKISGQKSCRVAEGHFQDSLEAAAQELRQVMGLS
ncbi:MAG: hypothetical protein AAGG51_02365 [Cyanobacteria bacterium P01_G01_bin.54]